MITTIVSHETPSHAMTPEEMHYEVEREVHVDCTLEQCGMKGALWARLSNTGHLPLSVYPMVLHVIGV
ncbi:hypothetical protein CRH09_25630 [Nocardia terpenica]|uniref:Uncharacterized protein n=1 Tax=Nocardia terpenica TaxID=455432 RepID=A0A291RNA9_9NOCA|nr:hypothetical protein CRH09_25630 [Nocardia terpenica]